MTLNLRLSWGIVVTRAACLCVLLQHTGNTGVAAFDASVLISNTRFKFECSIGREPGTAMPPDWASSGARLALPLEVQFLEDEHENTNDNKNNMERLLGPNRAKILKPINTPTFVSQKGTEQVEISSQGGWSASQYDGTGGVKTDVRFFLDFPNGAERNDVILPAERIYFATSCWLTTDKNLDRAKNLVKLTEEQFNKIKQELDAMVEEEKNKNPLEKATGIRSLVLMTEEKQRLERRLQLQRNALPKDDAVSCPNDVVMSKDGLMYVKRFGGLLRNREEYHIVGRFTCLEAELML